MTHGAPLTLYNSLTREQETFRPLDPGNVRVYSCGPTVYNYAHIGNLRAYVFTDTLSRVLTWKGYDLTHIINITDVGHLTSDADAGDDKMEAAARAQATSIWDIAAHYEEAFKANLKALNVRDPSAFPKATDHVAEMIAFAEGIAAKHCYRLESGLYFDVTTVPDYGRLARAQSDAGEGRIEAVAGKRHAHDFAIWRTSGPQENRQMEWDSPWGRGAPGWHLECSVMSKKYLGETFDIHTGGIDHREIHHPNEIAQNQAHCSCDDTGATIWMHNNFLVERKEDRASAKMSKSAGEFTRLQTLVDAGYHPLAYRLMCLQAHYRSELEFSWEGLAAAQVRLKRLVINADFFLARGTAGSWDHSTNEGAEQNLRSKLDDALADDLNTPRALTVLDELLSGSSIAPHKRSDILESFDDVFGLNLSGLTRADLRVRPAGATLTEADIDARLADRKQARAAKDFARSDAIRDELTAAGIEVMDGDPLGWDWKPTR